MLQTANKVQHFPKFVVIFLNSFIFAIHVFHRRRYQQKLSLLRPAQADLSVEQRAREAYA